VASEPLVVKARLGERVLLVPQACSELTNPHRPNDNAIGKYPHELTNVLGSRALDGAPQGKDRWTLPTWETYTSTLLQRGYGTMVVRDGKLQVGPSLWDSGD
jgi:hypothetical protein